MEGKSCFFIGHRDAESSLFPALVKVVEQHVSQYGVRNFLVGSYGGFDRLAARAVLQVRQDCPALTLSLLLPYHPAERPVTKPPGFDSLYYPPGLEKVPRRLAILRANRYGVDRSDHLIAYAWQPGSNSLKLVEYARRREKQGRLIITLLPPGHMDRREHS